LPGKPASLTTHGPKRNAAAQRSIHSQIPDKNCDDLSGHDFLPGQKLRGSHAEKSAKALLGRDAGHAAKATNALSGHDFSRAAKAAKSKRLQPRSPFFPTSLADSTNKNPHTTTTKRHKPPSTFVSVRNNSTPCFQQLTTILIEPMFRLETEANTQNQIAPGRPTSGTIAMLGWRRCARQKYCTSP
jgi:hypothetical protein